MPDMSLQRSKQISIVSNVDLLSFNVLSTALDIFEEL